jgi:anti-sigma regulatory factor (Ser/Thr protein kinase)
MIPEGHDAVDIVPARPEVVGPRDVPTRASTFELAVGRSPSGPKTARDGIRGWLIELSCPLDFVDDMTLIVSELVTNAIVHARSPALVTAALHDGCLRLGVDDASDARPAPRELGHGVGGYGLRLLATLAEGWGWTTTPAGKQVWSEFRVPGPR